jgi:hypothetical protein
MYTVAVNSKLLAVFSFMVLAIILASGQAGSAGAPVELAAGDRLIPPGLPATISGTTFTDGRPINAKLTVTLPGGTQRTKDIPISKEGRFETEFTETEAPGVYRFVIVSADSKTRVEGQFEVQTPSTIINRVEQAVQNFDRFNDRVEEAVDDRIDELPPSDPKKEVEEDFNDYRAWDQSLQVNKEAAINAIRRLRDFANTDPEGAAPAIASLGAWAEDVKDEIAERDTRLKEVENSKGVCEAINLASEGMSLLLAAAQPWATLGTIIKTEVVSRLTAEYTARAAAQPPRNPQPNPETEFGWRGDVTRQIRRLRTLTEDDPRFEDKKEAAKNTVDLSQKAVEGIESFTKALPSVVDPIRQYMMKDLFRGYCVAISGPIKGTYEETHRAGNQIWWRTKLTIAGKMTLYYEKGKGYSAKTGIPMKGWIEGNVTSVEFDENIFLIEEKPVTGTVVLRKKVPALHMKTDLANKGTGTALIRASMPGAYYLNYTAMMTDKDLTLKQGDAKFDFTSQFKNRLIMVGADNALPIPIVKSFDFPIQPAKFVIGRSQEEKDPTFPIVVEKDKVKVDETWTRNASLRNGEATVNWNFSLKLETER